MGKATKQAHKQASKQLHVSTAESWAVDVYEMMIEQFGTQWSEPGSKPIGAVIGITLARVLGIPESIIKRGGYLYDGRFVVQIVDFTEYRDA